MNKAKEMLMKGFNADCKEDENIINIAIKEAKKEGLNELLKYNSSFPISDERVNFEQMILKFQNTLNTEKVEEQPKTRAEAVEFFKKN